MSITNEHQTTPVNSGICVPIGVNIDNSLESIVFSPDSLHHMMVTGAIGSGKVVLLRSFINKILLNYTPNQAKLWLLDNGTLSMDIYQGSCLPHFEHILFDCEENALNSFIHKLLAIAQKRLQILMREQITSWSAYQESNSESPTIIAVADCSPLASNWCLRNHQFAEAFDQLMNCASAAGIILVLSFQSLNDTFFIPEALLGRFDLHVGFMQMDTGRLSECLPESFFQQLRRVHIGEAVLSYPMPHVIKTPYVSSSETRQLLEKLSHKYQRF